MTDILLQGWIVLTGAVAIWHLSDTTASFHRVRLGCLIGLAGQPCWFYETWKNFQWGMFLLTLAFTVSYLRTLLRPYFSKP